MEQYEVILTRDAVDDLDRLGRRDATVVANVTGTRLRLDPAKESHTRIRRLRGRQLAQYRLRYGCFRIFYSVREGSVHVLRVLTKAQTAVLWKKEMP